MANGTTKLYLIECEETGRIKIGLSSDPQKRLKDLQTGSPTRLRLRTSVGGADEQLESEIHNRCEEYAIRGEWFEPGVVNVFKQYPTVNHAFRYMAQDLCRKQGLLKTEGRKNRRAFRVRRGRLLQAPNGSPWVAYDTRHCPTCNAGKSARHLGDLSDGEIGECGGACKRKWKVVSGVKRGELKERWTFGAGHPAKDRPRPLDVQLWESEGAWSLEAKRPTPQNLNRSYWLLIASNRCANFCDRPAGVDCQQTEMEQNTYCSGCHYLNQAPPALATVPHPDGGDPIDCELGGSLPSRIRNLL